MKRRPIKWDGGVRPHGRAPFCIVCRMGAGGYERRVSAEMKTPENTRLERASSTSPLPRECTIHGSLLYQIACVTDRVRSYSPSTLEEAI